MLLWLIPRRRGLTEDQKTYFLALFGQQKSVNGKDIDTWLSRDEPGSREMWESVLCGRTKAQGVSDIHNFIKNRAARGGKAKRKPDLPQEVAAYFRDFYGRRRNPSVKDLFSADHLFRENLEKVKAVKGLDSDLAALDAVRSNLKSFRL